MKNKFTKRVRFVLPLFLGLCLLFQKNGQSQCQAAYGSLAEPAFGATVNSTAIAGGKQNWTLANTNLCIYTMSIPSTNAGTCGSYTLSSTGFTSTGAAASVDIYAGGSCCWSSGNTSAVLAYTKQAAVSVASVTPLTPICGVSGGSTRALSGATPAGGTYSKVSGPGTITTGGVWTPDGTSGTFTGKYTYGCSNANFTFTVGAAASISSTPTQICDNSSTTTLVGAPAGGTFTGSGNGSITTAGVFTSANIANPTPSASTSFTYSYQGCSSAAYTGLVVYNTPVITIGATEICETGTTTAVTDLTGIVPTPSAGGISSGTYTPPASGAGVTAPNLTATVTFDVSNGGCAATQKSLTLSNQVVITIGATEICETGTTTAVTDLTGLAPTPSVGSITSGTYTPPASGAGVTAPNLTANVTFDRTNGSCTATTKNLTLSNQVVIAIGATEICETSTTTAVTDLTGIVPTPSVGSISSGVYTPPGSGSGVAAPNLTANVTFNQTNGSCTATTRNLTLSNQVVIAVGATEICETGTTTAVTDLTGLIPSVTSGGIASGIFTPVNVSGATQNATVTFSKTNGSCTATPVNLTVSNMPTASTTASQILQCSNATTGSFTLNGNLASTSVTGSTGTWTSSCSGGGYSWSPNTNSNAAFYSTLPNNTTCTLTWTIVNGSCTSNAATVDLKYNANPTVTTGATQICDNGDGTSLTTNYNFSGTPSAVWSSSFTPSTVADMASGTGVLTVYDISAASPGSTQSIAGTVSATYGGCASTPFSVSIFNRPQWNPYNSGIGPAGGYCEGTAVALGSNVTGTTFNGPGVSGGVSPYTAPTPPSGNSVTTNVYANNTMSSNGCSVSALMTSYKNVDPATIASTPLNYCGTLVSGNLGGNSPTVGNGKWTKVSGPGSVTLWSPSDINPAATATVDAYGTYVFKWTITNGSCVDDENVTVNYYQTPTTATAGSDQTKCNTPTFTMVGNNPSAGTGAWSVVSSTPSGTTAAGTYNGTTTLPTAQSTATLRWTISNGTCTPSTADVVLTNDANPTTAAAGSDIAQCNTPAFTMAGNNPSVGTGAWSIVSSTPSGTTAAGTYNGTTTLPTAQSTATLRWTTSNGVCTPSTDDVILTNDAIPTAASAGVAQDKCNTATFTMAGNNPSVGTGAWSVVSSTPSGTTAAGTYNGATTLPSAQSTATLRWTISNGACTPSTDDVILTNNLNPTAAPAFAANPVCGGSGTTLSANATAGSGSITTYAWSSVLGNVASGTVSNAGTYTVTVTNSNGCTVQSTSPSLSLVTASANMTLNTVTKTALLEQCTESGWTYYSDPSDASKFLFAIYKNGSTATFSPSITVKASSPVYDLKERTAAMNPNMPKANFTMGRYWNVSYTGTLGTVGVRFYFDTNDVTTMQDAADAWAVANPTALAGYTTKVFDQEWFKVLSGDYDPANNTISDVGSHYDYPLNRGTTGATPITYQQYDTITSFSGGTVGIRVAPVPNGNNPIGLPVEWLYFTARATNNYIQLDWATASEINNKGFEIERSADGINYTKIAWVEGNNYSTQTLKYRYDDKDVVSNRIYYYRLKQIDHDGQEDYSQIVSARIREEGGFEISELVPNPAQNKVNIYVSTQTDQTVKLKLTDLLGQEVFNRDWLIQNGTNGLEIDLRDIPSGPYTVTLVSGNAYTSKKLIIAK